MFVAGHSCKCGMPFVLAMHHQLDMETNSIPAPPTATKLSVREREKQFTSATSTAVIDMSLKLDMLGDSSQ
jgi:hypothetical protein